MGIGGSHLHVPDEASLVIVGAGYGGVSLASQLHHSGKMKIINQEEFFFHNVGALRSCVEPDFAKRTMIPLKETFGDAFIQGKVVKINKETNTVSLDTGEEIKYTHLFLATGATGPFPSKLSKDHPKVSKEDAIQLYKDMNKEITEAETIVCVGGGAVGVELAGEIKCDYPSKKVILIHPNNNLCSSRLSESAQSKLQDAVRRVGVELMLGERVSNLPDLQIAKCVKDQILKTESGKEIKADLVFRCTGSKPATDHFKDALGDAMNDKGLVKVDQYLKVEGTDNIYAIGDITAIEEEKMAVAAQCHADLILKNLKASFSGKQLHPYKSGEFIMIVPVGRNAGVGQLPKGIVIGDFLSKNIKGKHLFVSKYWGVMKQKAPQ